MAAKRKLSGIVVDDKGNAHLISLWFMERAERSGGLNVSTNVSLDGVPAGESTVAVAGAIDAARAAVRARRKAQGKLSL